MTTVYSTYRIESFMSWIFYSNTIKWNIYRL